MSDSTSLPAELRHLPLTIFSGNWKTPHVQGIAVDTKREFIYFSFTTMLLKTDLQGNPLYNKVYKKRDFPTLSTTKKFFIKNSTFYFIEYQYKRMVTLKKNTYSMKNFL